MTPNHSQYRDETSEMKSSTLKIFNSAALKHQDVNANEEEASPNHKLKMQKFKRAGKSGCLRTGDDEEEIDVEGVDNSDDPMWRPW